MQGERAAFIIGDSPSDGFSRDASDRGVGEVQSHDHRTSAKREGKQSLGVGYFDDIDFPGEDPALKPAVQFLPRKVVPRVRKSIALQGYHLDAFVVFGSVLIAEAHHRDRITLLTKGACEHLDHRSNAS